MLQAILIISLLLSILVGNNAGRPLPTIAIDPFRMNETAKIGDNSFPTNPMSDRARGYLLQGKAQTAITNYGNYIDIEVNPNGAWGEYAYLYEVSFLAGIPGHSNSSNYSWNNIESITDDDGFPIYGIWESQSAYDAWFENGDTNFVGVIFNAENDFGLWEPDSISKKASIDDLNDLNQWAMDHESNKILITVAGNDNPNRSITRIGLIHPWALQIGRAHV